MKQDISGKKWGESGERETTGAERGLSNGGKMERHKIQGRQIL
jgi:hypothetical protein